MLRLGELTIPRPWVQAALSGYSDLPMRRVARSHGATYALNEVVINEKVLERGKGRKRILNVPDDEHPVGGQLMGSQPALFARAATELVDAGYDVVDINFGCPVGKVLGRCRGGYLLGTPTVALEIIDRVVDACRGRVPVTLKMRRGTDDSPESEARFFEILDGAYERGVVAVTVHGRSVRQKYIGPSDWSFLARVKRHLGPRVLLGSGDLFSADDVMRIMAETGVDGVTIARGAIGNPFIFEQCDAVASGEAAVQPSLERQAAAITMHFEEACRVYPEGRAVGKTRRHAIQYAELHHAPIGCRDAWIGLRSAAGIDEILECWYRAGAEIPAEGPTEGPTEGPAEAAASDESC